MHIIISAQFCTFEATSMPGVTMMSTMLFSDQVSRDTFQVERAAQLQAQMQLVFDATKAAHPGRSFYVSQTRHPRDPDRAFAGYKKFRHRMEHNANEEATEAATA